MDRNPQAEQMASDAMVRTLAAQAEAIWPQESALFAAYGLPEDARILDVGCGTGEVTTQVALANPAAEVLGIDVHGPHVERSRAAAAHVPNVRFAIGDGFSLDHDDHRFDLVMCRHVIQSLPQPELALAEFRRVLKPGGVLHLLAEDYGMIHFHPTQTDSDRFWREGPRAFAATVDNDLWIGRKMLTILRQAGFRQVDVQYVRVDTLNTDREVFARIWEAWRDGYTVPVAENTALSLAEVEAFWADMIGCLRNPEGYGLWQIPIWSGRR